MSEQTVTNSTCLIGLERIGRLDILPQVFSSITIPLGVKAEVGLSLDWLTVTAVQNIAVVSYIKNSSR